MALVPTRLRTPLSYLMIFGLLAGVYLLPADTSLSEVRRAGLLRACMPPVYPPLVTADPAAPGIDVELLRALAEKLTLKFVISPNPAMGQDFNPRNWRGTRAQCEVLAGQLAAREGFRVEWAPAELPRFPVVFGLWKGDLTLKRAIVDGLTQLEKSGEMAKIMARYRGERAGSNKG